MKKSSKFHKLLRWIFNQSSIGYKTHDDKSVNSLSILIDMKVIENAQFIKDKQTKKMKKVTKKFKKSSRKKSIDTHLDSSQMFKSNSKNRFKLKNELIEQFDSNEDYLNKLWTPRCAKDRVLNQEKTINLLNFESTSEPPNLYAIKQSDVVNLLLKECYICENDLNDLNSPLEIMPCRCVFHLYCISSHLIFEKICPFCFTLFSKKQLISYNKKWKDRYWLS